MSGQARSRARQNQRMARLEGKPQNLTTGQSRIQAGVLGGPGQEKERDPTVQAIRTR